MFKFLLLSTILISTNVNGVYAADEVETAPQKSASMKVDENYNNWRRAVSNKLISNCEAKNIDINLPECDFSANVVYGDAIVKLKSDNPKWVDARSMAYTEALVDAYSKIALEQSTTNQNIFLKELIDDQTPLGEDAFKEDTPNQPLLDKALSFTGGTLEKRKAQLSVLWDKVFALADGTLGKRLEELGIDSETYRKAPLEKKKTLLKSAITQKSITKALADTSGMIPLQTFEGNDDKGNYAVRVAISTSSKRVALVKSMLREGYNVPPQPNKKASKSVDDQVILSEDILFNQFGTRLVYDKEGYPVLISFGQAGVVNSGSEAMKAVKLESARSTAKTNARAALTNLLRSSTVFKSVVTQVSKSATDMKLISGDDGITEEMIEENDYTNAKDESTTTKSQITNFAGIRELHNWSYIHPQLGYEVVGTILMWSPKTAARAKGIQSTQNKNSDYGNRNYTPEAAGSQRGIETDDYDF